MLVWVLKNARPQTLLRNLLGSDISISKDEDTAWYAPATEYLPNRDNAEESDFLLSFSTEIWSIPDEYHIILTIGMLL